MNRGARGAPPPGLDRSGLRPRMTPVTLRSRCTMILHEVPRAHGKPMDRHDASPLPGPLAHRLGADADADAAQVADAVTALWREIDRVLHPIIGRRGVLALYNRSLKLAAARYPWLADGHPGALAAVDAAALRAALAQQPTADALAAGHALFQGLRDLLASLIGVSLTDRLLGSVWGPPPEAPPAQDNAP
ncbi:MAG: hypothetical protein KF683_11740 [Rubrivivax sp.]|nr:hypothetical protein [Rubrivivax sp.]